MHMNAARAPHRPERGFTLKSGFALTQGAAMSNTKSGPGTTHDAHKHIHVRHNRTSGPLNTPTFALIAPLLLAAAIIGLFSFTLASL